MATAVKIEGLTQYGDAGWEWTEEIEAGWLESPLRRYCHTNRAGEGLWYEDRQVAGTCQFSLPRSRKAAYSKIRREALKSAA